MAELALISTIASIGGTIMQGMGQMQAGKAANVNAQFQAKQLEQKAGQDRASSQRVAIEKRREASVASSNAIARAGASGGGVDDPTVLNILGGLHQQGEYNALSALFSGEEAGRSAELQAAGARMEGKQAKKAGMIGGISTIATGAGKSLMDIYGAPSAPASSSSLPWQAPGNVRPDFMGGGYY